MIFSIVVNVISKCSSTNYCFHSKQWIYNNNIHYIILFQELPQIANEANRIRESADAKTKELAEKNAVLNKRIVELNAKLHTNAKKQAAFGKEAKKVTVMAKEKITDQSQALQEMEVSC